MARETAQVTELVGLRRLSTDPIRQVKRFLRKKPLGVFGLAIIILLWGVALLAPLLAPADPYAQSAANNLRSPSFQHLMGTDELGRDLLSRIIWGARISVAVGFAAVAFGHGTGFLLGLVGAYYGGKLDMGIQRLIEIKMAFPGLMLALVIMSVLGPSIVNVIIAIGIGIIPTSTRVIRSQALSVRQTEYVLGARAIGATDWRIITRHMAPNCLAPLIIVATASLGGAILTEASLSFLGVGTPPPQPSWGLMLSGAAQRYLEIAPHMAIFPGVAISLAVFGFNLFGDALRDIWDPKLRGR